MFSMAARYPSGVTARRWTTSRLWMKAVAAAGSHDAQSTPSYASAAYARLA